MQRSRSAPQPRQALSRFLETVALAACYLLAAFIGLRFAVPPGNATAIWPASGIALAGVLVLGPSASLGIWIGATLANLTTAVSFPSAAVIGLGDTLEALAAAWLLRRGGRPVSFWFRDARGVFAFVGITVIASILAASVGTSLLAAGGKLAGSSTAMNWVTWWLGDIAGIVIVTPLLIALRRSPGLRASTLHGLEGGLAAVTLVLVAQVLFGGFIDRGLARDLLFLPLFLLIWLALRFDLRAVTAATFAMSAAAVWGTSKGVGVYSGREVHEAFLGLQVLMISYALTGLLLSVTVNRRRRAESVVLRSRNHLARVVGERTAELRLANEALSHEVKERTRREEMERLRLSTALESAGEGIMITDADANITHSNPAFERMTGYSRAEVVGKTPRILKSGKQDAAFYQQLWETISKGGVWRGSFVDRKKDSSLYDVESTIAPIHEAGGAIAGYVAVTRDVTSQRNAERALRDSESRLRTIFDSAADGIVTIDEEGVIESANAAVESMFGIGIPELVGRSVATLLGAAGEDEPPGSRVELRLGDIGLPLRFVKELVGRRKDGRTFRADVMLNEVLLEGRRLYGCFIRDATERHARFEAERALLRAHEELRLAREIQQRFYPAAAPEVPGFDIAGTSRPAEQAGGDCFDYLPMSDGRLGFVIGDVSGHGLGPALLMSQTQAFLRSLLLCTQEVSELITHLNTFLLADCGSNQFVTLFLARLDPLERKLVYASGGHQGHLLRADGQVETLCATGIPLGIRPWPIRGAPELSLSPGDLLLVLTDGIEEATSTEGREMGRRKILELVQANRHRPACEIVAALVSAADEFAHAGVQTDDITALVVKVLD